MGRLLQHCWWLEGLCYWLAQAWGREGAGLEVHGDPAHCTQTSTSSAPTTQVLRPQGPLPPGYLPTSLLWPPPPHSGP